MPELERICEQLSSAEDTHNDFRLWLTSMPSQSFPSLLLQNGVKMTNEPPKGLRANLVQSFTAFDDRELDSSKKPDVFKPLLFGFCFFHAIAQDRRKYGPIGWNIPYGFTMEDLVTCKRQLQYFVDEYDHVPYKVLNFLGAKINYGGRVTDAIDKRLAECILKKYITAEIVEKGPEYKFSKSGFYYCPKAESQEEFLNYLKGLPMNPAPEAFGMSSNCEITCAEAETAGILENLLSMAPKSGGGGGKSAEDQMDEAAANILDLCPEPFDYDEVDARYPTLYDKCLNTVLKQDVMKYNRLIKVILQSVPLFRKALKGLVAMNPELEELGTGLFTNSVPGFWASVGFLSLKPLSAWVTNLTERVKFFSDWIALGDSQSPLSFWLDGFFFPQAFFTGALQNHARANKIAIDKLCFHFKVRDDFTLDGTDITEDPDSGVYVRGLFMDGARWCSDKHCVDEAMPKVLFPQVPVIHFQPSEDFTTNPKDYECPMYKVLSRRGVLSTTGHSTNFVAWIRLPSVDHTDHWIRAGVAIVLALKY
eukprot:gene673-986_t